MVTTKIVMDLLVGQVTDTGAGEEGRNKYRGEKTMEGKARSIRRGPELGIIHIISSLKHFYLGETGLKLILTYLLGRNWIKINIKHSLTGKNMSQGLVFRGACGKI